MKRIAAIGSLILVSTAVLATESKIDYQILADRTPFHWPVNESTILYSLSQMPGYKFRMDYDSEVHGMYLSFLKGGKVVFSFKGHKHSVFKIHEDILYYPIFHYSSSGLKIVAYDLKNGKELWRKSIMGIGRVKHSAYRNVITLNVNSDVVTILGHENYGDYIEFVDRKSGDTVGHRTYNMSLKQKRHLVEPKDAGKSKTSSPKRSTKAESPAAPKVTAVPAKKLKLPKSKGNATSDISLFDVLISIPLPFVFGILLATVGLIVILVYFVRHKGEPSQ